MMHLNRQSLVAHISSKKGLSAAEASEILSAMFEEIGNSLIEGMMSNSQTSEHFLPGCQLSVLAVTRRPKNLSPFKPIGALASKHPED